MVKKNKIHTSLEGCLIRRISLSSLALQSDEAYMSQRRRRRSGETGKKTEESLVSHEVNKKLLGTSATLEVTSALLVVTKSY